MKTNHITFPSGNKCIGSTIYGPLTDNPHTCIGSAYGVVPENNDEGYWEPSSVPAQHRNARLFAAATDMEALLFEASQRHIPAKLRARIAHVLELIDTES